MRRAVRRAFAGIGLGVVVLIAVAFAALASMRGELQTGVALQEIESRALDLRIAVQPLIAGDDARPAVERQITEFAPQAGESSVVASARARWQPIRIAAERTGTRFGEVLASRDRCEEITETIRSTGSSVETMARSNDLDGYGEVVTQLYRYLSSARNARAMILRMPQGDAMEQAALSLSVDFDRIEAVVAALIEGDEDFGVEGLEYEDDIDEEVIEELEGALERLADLRVATDEMVAGRRALCADWSAAEDQFPVVLAAHRDDGERAQTAAERAAGNVPWALFALLVGVVAAMAALLTLLLRRVFTPLQGMISRLATSEGDLTITFDEGSRDEIGELASYYNRYTEALRELVTSVQSSVQEMQRVSAEVAETSEHLSEGARQTSVGSDEAAQESQVMAGDVRSVARETESLAGNVTEVLRHIVERLNAASETTGGSAGASSDALEMVQGANREFDAVSTAAGSITEIVGTIGDIATRTNLLALNAKIESARAGAAGSGFAVVADEVKALALRTAQATDNVREVVEQLVATAAGASQALVDVRGRVEQAAEMSRSTATDMERDSAESRNASQEMQNVSAATVSTARGLEERTGRIEERMQALSAIAEETSQRAERTASSSKAISVAADRLSELSRRFRV